MKAIIKVEKRLEPILDFRLVTSSVGLISGTSGSGLLVGLFSNGLTAEGFGGDKILDKDRPNSTLSNVADSCNTAESMTHAVATWNGVEGDRSTTSSRTRNDDCTDVCTESSV